jgi:thiol-disulfide isomerase/thioredoxin
MISVMLIYAESCAHCKTIKPVFDAMAPRYPTIAFMKREINEIFDTYMAHAEKNEDGSPKIVLPNFFIFDSAEIGPENTDGFVGGFDGANPAELEHVLEALSGRV